MRGTENHFVIFSVGFARFIRRVSAESESIVTAVALPLVFLPSLKANSYPSRRNRETSGVKGERECLVSATQWGYSLKGLEPRRPKLWVRVTFTRKREEQRRVRGRGLNVTLANRGNTRAGEPGI